MTEEQMEEEIQYRKEEVASFKERAQLWDQDHYISDEEVIERKSNGTDTGNPTTTRPQYHKKPPFPTLLSSSSAFNI